mmetsp:Transcript_3400/g.8554  ORF Transcript_3400/g.8554 Transcript_3400/m.8554 type:complete len:108 (+) Transcript_3400:1147-1470(+)
MPCESISSQAYAIQTGWRSTCRSRSIILLQTMRRRMCHRLLCCKWLQQLTRRQESREVESFMLRPHEYFAFVANVDPHGCRSHVLTHTTCMNEHEHQSSGSWQLKVH